MLNELKDACKELGCIDIDLMVLNNCKHLRLTAHFDDKRVSYQWSMEQIEYGMFGFIKEFIKLVKKERGLSKCQDQTTKHKPHTTPQGVEI